MGDNNELLAIFWEEVGDHLNTLNQALLQVEMSSGEERQKHLKEMNRVAHSMKGASRAVGMSLIEQIAHHMEEVFYYALEKAMPLTPAIADSLYDGLDVIQNVMSHQENDEDIIARVLDNLAQVVVQFVPLPAVTPAVAVDPSPAEVIPIVPSTPSPLETTELPLRPLEETLRVSVGKLDALMAEVSELSIVKMRGDMRYTRMSALRRQLSKWLKEWRTVRTAYIRLVRRLQDRTQEATPEVVALLRFLETNQRYLAEANRELTGLLQMLANDHLQLTTLTDQLQDYVARLRMMPFESVVGGFQRMVRDIARDLNKQAQLTVKGASVELDKTVLDALKDPLMHLLRNALDHAIEPESVRVEQGKPPQGELLIALEQRGNEIVIRVSDDGRGLDVAKIRQKAIQRGLLSAQEATQLDDDGARQLVFQSGFSTSDHVTAMSGRGLGMDIVRDRIESLRGRVSLTSQEGVGTTVTLSVPMSLTRLRCILMRVGDEEYAVPSAMVARMEKLPRQAVYTANGQRMVALNGVPVPFVALADVLESPMTLSESDVMSVLALSALERTVAFEVDDLYNELELVLKPLGRELANAPFVVGGALLGSGDVVLVLDANDLVRSAIGAQVPRRSRSATLEPDVARPRLHVLIVDDSITTRTLEKNILEAIGFEVSVAVDGVEAWSKLRDELPDVVVSDVEMPNMNGLELAHRIKNDPRTRHLPVILLTSLGKPEQREAGLRAGADAYLVKSQFDQNELLATIHSVL